MKQSQKCTPMYDKCASYIKGGKWTVTICYWDNLYAVGTDLQLDKL